MITKKNYEGGSLLEAAVHAFKEERNKPNFVNLLVALCNSYVWIPCTAVLSEKDQARLEAMVTEMEDNLEGLTGKEFIANDPTRLVPDILQKGENFYFPIFSNVEAMGDYGDNFSKVQKHILEIIPLARNNEKEPIGIVLNAFSESFILDKEFWDILEKMHR